MVWWVATDVLDFNSLWCAWVREAFQDSKAPARVILELRQAGHTFGPSTRWCAASLGELMHLATSLVWTDSMILILFDFRSLGELGYDTPASRPCFEQGFGFGLLAFADRVYDDWQFLRQVIGAYHLVPNILNSGGGSLH